MENQTEKPARKGRCQSKQGDMAALRFSGGVSCSDTPYRATH